MELELETLKKKDIKISDTALAKTITVKRMELNAAVENFSKEERNAMRARLAMLDNKERNDLAAVVPSLPELPVPELTEPGSTPQVAILDKLLLEPTGRADADDEEEGNAVV